mmetsp:Transcript_14561/g.40205  ORF Transcript_14561/g.40205 Transcript_14561/m.40205 type:complete len:461 (+) Transcript_14561:148-1530(+)
MVGWSAQAFHSTARRLSRGTRQVAAVLVDLEGILELLGLVRLPLVEVHEALEVAVTELVESGGLYHLLHPASQVRVLLHNDTLPMHGRQVRMRDGSVADWFYFHWRGGARACQPDEGALVVASVQIIRGAEHAEEVGVVPAVTVGLHLVRAHNALQLVLLAELLCHIRTEHVDTLALPVGGTVAGSTTRVAPEDVDKPPHVVHLLVSSRWAEGLRVRVRCDLQVAVDRFDLVKRWQEAHGYGVRRVVGLPGHPDARVRPRQASMQDQHLLLDKVAEGEVPESLGEQVKEAHVIFGPTLATEAVENVCLKHLVVPAIHVHEAGVLQLERKQHHDHFNGPRTTVHKVAVEEVGIRGARLPMRRQDAQEVKELPVHVAHDVQVAARGHQDALQRALALQHGLRIAHKRRRALFPLPAAPTSQEFTELLCKLRRRILQASVQRRRRHLQQPVGASGSSSGCHPR